MNTQIETLARGAAIIEGNQEKFRRDGYTNLLNKYGTGQDNSTAYQYADVPYIADSMISGLYGSNGLFAKIIDRPAEEAVKHGLDIDFGSKGISEYVDEQLDTLEYEDKVATAEKWSRLFGGAIIVMLIDDGRGLEEPVDKEKVKGIRELKVYERAVVQPDYYTKTDYKSRHQISEPEFFDVSSRFEQFKVHVSRCLVFRNGRLPEFSMNEIYRYWGVPEYIRIKNELRECVTAHGNGTRLLERSVQAIYKMKNLATLLATDDGENKVLQRLQVIDMARGILNSIAIDTDGEDYDYKNFSLSGIKDVIDSTCNMLSAVTSIPQTILFGRSPAGMNSTGESDMENFYNMVENIQKRNIKSNTRTIIDYILKQGVYEGVIQGMPTFKIKFAELWSMSSEEKANVEKANADTEHIKAQTLQTYLDSGVIDVSEVRKKLADAGIIEAEPSEADIPFSELIEEEIEPETQVEKPTVEEITEDETEIGAAAVIIIKDGKILTSIRKDNFTFCGAGGKVEADETIEEAAIREATEEFNIVPDNLIPLGALKDTTGDFMDTMVYFTTEYSGTPQADGLEMEGMFWFSLEELSELPLFPPFAKSLEMLKNTLTSADNSNTINADGGPGSGRYPKGSGKKKTSQSDYQRELLGIKTSKGSVVKNLSKHFCDRAISRNIYPENIANALKKGKVTKGNTPNIDVYKYKGTNVMFDNKKKTVVTAIYRSEEKEGKRN